MAFLELQGLTKQYGDFTAVEEFNLSVAKGEFICLLGPSGCGKTTTLQMVAGLTQPTNGLIELDGRISPGCAATCAAWESSFKAMLCFRI